MVIQQMTMVPIMLIHSIRSVIRGPRMDLISIAKIRMENQISAMEKKI